jgi:hypothetical protein
VEELLLLLLLLLGVCNRSHEQGYGQYSPDGSRSGGEDSL